MIKLKDLLNERMYGKQLNDKFYPAHSREALSWSLTHDYVPLYPKTMESIIGKVPIDAFHVTDPSHIGTLQQILGKKKSISTFNAANKSSQLAKGRGVQTGSGGVIFHVEGLLLAQKGMDFDTVPDLKGRRWVKGFDIFGDRMILKSALKRAKLPDYSAWQDIEAEVEEKIENDPKYDGLRYMERIKAVREALGPLTAKHLKKYIDTTNKLLKKHKKKVVANLTKPSNETSAWWNEILIYNVKVKDVFVLKRVWDDYYFQQDKDYDPSDGSSKLAYKKQLLKYVPESKITIGSPAQFRKWYTARKGEITV